MPARVQPPAPPYLGPAKFHGGEQTLKPLRRIVIHGTVSPCVPGGARDIARYFATTVTRPSSAHYVVDPGEVVQVVGDHQVAYHAPPNTDTIGIEHCDPVVGPLGRWNDDSHTRMLLRSAELVAQLCLAYDLPIRHVGTLGLKAGMRGITGHLAVGRAWGQTDHSDPGEGFPWRRYIGMVKTAAKRLQADADDKANPKPPVVPIPVLPETTPPTKAAAMTLVTANIRNNPDMPRQWVREDTSAVRALGGVLLWQEIGEQDDRDDLATSLPGSAWEHVQLDTEVPMSFYRANWQVRATGKQLLHVGRAGVSPSRFLTWAEVSRKDAPEVPPVVVINTHWVSGAFSHAGQDSEEWRRAMWEVSHTKLSQVVGEFLARGKTVVGGGDYNRTGVWPGFAANHQWLMHGVFDHLWVCEAPGGARVMALNTGTLGTDKLHTDHPARWAHVRLMPAKKG